MRVRERLSVEAASPLSEAEIAHTLAVKDGDLISKVKVSSPDGIARFEMEVARPLARLTVFYRTARARERFDYALEFEVHGGGADSYRCPLAVPELIPRDPYQVVSLQVLLPPSHVHTGQPFPSLMEQGEKVVGRLGAIPAFVRVPHGEDRFTSRLARHVSDALVLLIIGVSTVVWLRLRGVG